VPWVVSGADLGQNVLELGPGPGLTTDLLRLKLERLTAIEVDPGLAASLRSRLSGSNVEVIAGDATTMPFADGQFSGAVSLTMLHHVPSPELQDQLLREVWRVIAPGGVFVGSDSIPSLFMRLIHIGDTLVPVAPGYVWRAARGRRISGVGGGKELWRISVSRTPASSGLR
jgi:SAM-dependent methyltransferase